VLKINTLNSFFREEPFYDIQLNVKGKKDSKCFIGFIREMEMNLNKLSEIERSDWSRAISSKRDVLYSLAPKRLLF